MMALLLILLAPLLFSSSLAAPRSGDRLEAQENVLNPFTLGNEQLSLLQGYLRDEDPMEESTSDMKRETVILHLFVLHDFDKSGLLDGLELMRLLRRILAKSLQKEPSEDLVISLVDDILVKQDLNQDGLLSTQELVTPPVFKAEDSPPLNVALPIPPGAHPPAQENEAEIQTNTTNASEPADQEAESKDNMKEQTHDPAPSQEEAEATQEKPAVIDHEAASVERTDESEELEEPTEDNGQKQFIQGETVSEDEM
ncbi:cell growth regulator with EF hand domain protein 1 isoform X2 [Rana temporaria]|uniref:cell growth regulator with EF hand domain protein 1 isoform X2 n=1 Tax=Rana temporaria TaxID=8407 RepID=UPI001AAC82A0|nr:cell growth regulator with EF hand domain protein 1 isoform X2 [Rana temporaria]